MGVEKTSFHPHNGLGMRLEILHVHVYIYSSYITLIGVDKMYGEMYIPQLR